MKFFADTADIADIRALADGGLLDGVTTNPSLIMPRLAGRRAAARHILLGEPFGADQALAMGLASHVVAKGDHGAALAKVVAALIAKPAEAMRLTQALLRRSDRAEVIERMELENGHFGERLTSDEVKAAITAFFTARAAR